MECPDAAIRSPGQLLAPYRLFPLPYSLLPLPYSLPIKFPRPY